MYNELKKIYDRNRKDVFVMAVGHLMDIGYRRALALTDEDIEGIGGNGLMTEEFCRDLVKLSREIAKASSPSELIMFCETESIFDTASYAPWKRQIPYDRMSEIATTALSYIYENKDDDWGCECVLDDLYLEPYEMEYFGFPADEDEEEENEDY